MEAHEGTIKLYYNTESKPLSMPEYGRNILKMVEYLKTLEDKAERSEQARAVIKAMELLNPAVHQMENFEQKLWDHLYLIAGLDLDIDAPYPAPSVESLQTRPMPIPLKRRPIKASHYGRNIESMIDLVAEEAEGEIKTAMIRSLAIYMRQQYLIWNKDSVADETIFADIEKLSDGRIKVPSDISLAKISDNVTFSRPGIGINVGQAVRRNRPSGHNQRRNRKK